MRKGAKYSDQSMQDNGMTVAEKTNPVKPKSRKGAK